MTAESRLSDATLVERIRGGDEGAFQALFERYAAVLRARVERLLSPKLRRKISASDVLQEGRIVALRRIAEFEVRGDGSVRNWLMRIVELKLREAIKRHGTIKRAAGREISRDGRARTAQFVGNQPSPSEVAIARELREIVNRARQMLPADYREVLRLAREEGLPLKDVAERMGRSYEATKKLYGRAAAQFVEVFERLRGTRDA